MRYMKRVASALSLACGLTTTASLQAQIPTGWQAFADNPTEYAVRADGARRTGGQGYAGATIRASVASPAGTGMLAQSLRADDYRGQRIRLSGYMRTSGVTEGSAVLFMRVDGEGVVQTSDYMQNRPLMLDNDWARQEIVLDVPRTAVGMTFGMLLGGSGQVWLDDVAIEVVDTDTPVTGRAGGLYPNQLNARDLEKKRRDQEVAYRNVSMTPINLALRAEVGAITVAAIPRPR
jgi:hypothetical protein